MSADIAGAVRAPASLKKLAKIDPKTLPAVRGQSAPRRLRRRHGKIHLHRPQLFRPRGGDGRHGSVRADHLHEGDLGDLSARTTTSLIPRGSKKTDWEVELGVVIGKKAKYVSEAEALDHVAGYCVVNDVSERAFQTERQGQWTKGKSCDTFGPTGPWLVTKDEVTDPQNLEDVAEVNGKKMQDGSSKTMVHGVAHLVSYLSQFMGAAARRHHLDRHAARRRPRHEAAEVPEERRRGRARHRRAWHAEADLRAVRSSSPDSRRSMIGGFVIQVRPSRLARGFRRTISNPCGLAPQDEGGPGFHPKF